jgi:hypothetical protein
MKKKRKVPLFLQLQVTKRKRINRRRINRQVRRRGIELLVWFHLLSDLVEALAKKKEKFAELKVVL